MKTKFRTLLTLLFLAPAGVLNGATLTFDFTSSLLYTQPGRQVTFSGTLTNTGLTTAFLNGDAVTFPLPFDDTPFLLGAPLTLAPGAFFTGPLLTVIVAPATPWGLYSGSFSVLGGDNAANLAVLAARPFAVQVVPEPATCALAAVGMAGAFLLRRRALR